MLRGGSRSFFAASLVLPRRVHEPATALYAFCRIADDAIDCDGGGAAALDPLRDRLARAYAGRPLPFRARCPRRCSTASNGTRRAAATRILPTCATTRRGSPAPWAR